MIKSFFKTQLQQPLAYKSLITIYSPWAFSLLLTWYFFGFQNYAAAYYAVFIGWVPTIILKILFVEAADEELRKKLKFDPNIRTDIMLKVLRANKVILIASIVSGLLLYPMILSTFNGQMDWTTIPIIFITTVTIIMVLAGMLNAIRARFYLGKLIFVFGKGRPFNDTEDMLEAKLVSLSPWGFVTTFKKISSKLISK